MKNYKVLTTIKNSETCWFNYHLCSLSIAVGRLVGLAAATNFLNLSSSYESG